MKRFMTALAVLWLSLACSVVYAQTSFPTSRVKIDISQADLKKLKASGIEFDHGIYDFEHGTFENEFPGEDVEKIRALGYRVEVLVADVARYTDSINRVEDPMKYADEPVRVPNQYRNMRLNFTTNQNFEASIPTPSTFSLGSMGGFYNLAELNAQLDDMVAKYPTLVKKSSIGNTLKGLPTYVIKISDNVDTDEDEPEILYTGMHHAREGMSMMNLIFYMRFLLENYATNPSIKEIIDNRELFFIPVSNVDGFNYNTTATNWNASRRMRRKNMQETTTSNPNADGSGGDGVDINRNYPTYWGLNYSNGNTASSATGSADAYRGTSAASEPETQNMMAFVNSRQFKMAMNYHCYGNWWIRPEGPDPAVYPAVALPAAAVSNYNSIAAVFAKYNCYVYGTANQTVYDVNGYSDDWLFSDPSHSTIYAFSPEIGASGDGFWCPQAKIIPYAKELIFPNLQAAYTAGTYAELQDTSDIEVTATTGTFGYTVTRRGLVDGSIKITLIPMNNIQSAGNPVTIASIANFAGQVSGGISYTLLNGITAGTPIRYVWQVEAGGITTRDTITKFYKPTQVFADFMDAGVVTTKWTRTGTSSAWDYESGTGVLGTASLTESKNGNYANSADQSVRIANALDLSGAVQAYLSYMIKYSTENCQDRLQVEVSTTGVNGTYTPIVTKTTIKESRGSLGNFPAITGNTDGWVKDVVNLSSYVGNNNFSFRFRFLSNATNTPAYTPDGFQIDNVKVVKTNSYILPLMFGDITAVKSGNAVLVQWKATTDASFHSYIIQRSQDGTVYQTLGNLMDPEATTFTDQAPVNGKNYYRVQLVSNTGQVVYSRVVTVVFEESLLVRAYPNPFVQELTIEVYNDREEKGSVEIRTMEGRLLHTENMVLKKGITLHKLAPFHAAAQFCLLVVRSSSGNVIQTQRLYKAGVK